MMISIIVAMDENNGIAKDGQMPWHISTDLRRFKALTLGHHVIMGRKTYVSIGKPLPGRVNIVVTRQEGLLIPGCLLASSLKKALALAEQGGETEAFVIGGGQIYAQALPLAQRIYLSRVHTWVDADVFFPALAADEWQESGAAFFPAGGRDEFAHTFYTLTRLTNLPVDV